MPPEADDPHVVHPGITCDSCGARTVRGVRYKCSQCANVDLCEACEASPRRRYAIAGHPRWHLFLKIRHPRDSPDIHCFDFPLPVDEHATWVSTAPANHLGDAPRRWIPEMWEERCRTGVGMCVICPTCGGSSASTCPCARARFFQSVTGAQIDQWLARRQRAPAWQP